MIARAISTALLTSILWVGFSVAQGTTRAIGVTEDELKAVFVVRLLDFVQREQPLENTKICLLGRSDTTIAIKRLVTSRGLSNLSIDEVEAGEPIDSCHLLFDGTGVLRGKGGMQSYFHVLTVSDRDGFAEEGGMVELVRAKNRVGLTINAETVRAADIQLSSRLLMLANVIGVSESKRNHD